MLQSVKVLFIALRVRIRPIFLRRIEMIKYLRKETIGILLNIAGLFTVSGLQVYAALRMTKVAEYLIQ